MKTRNSALYALGLAAAITIGSTVSVDAQTRRPTRRQPTTRIPVRKEPPVVAKTDTVYVTRVDTVTVRRADTITTTMMRYDTVTRMVYPPLAPLPGLFFGIGAGSDIPMNNIRAVVKDSYAFQGQVGYFPGTTFQGQVGYFPGTSPIGVRADMTWGQLKARETDCRTCTSPKLFTAGGDVILRMPIDRSSKLNPVLYVFGGGGYAKLSNVDPRQTAVAGGNGGVNFINSGDLYYDVGPGIDFSLGGLRVYAEGKYMTILSGKATGTSNQSNIHLFPVFAGLKFGF
jgi:hypothetical protein